MNKPPLKIVAVEAVQIRMDRHADWWREHRFCLTYGSKEVAVSMSLREAAQLLGVKSANTVKNWLEGGHFPGASKTKGGHWRFPKDEVLKAKDRLSELAKKNRERDLAPVDFGDDAPEPPLL